jgi:hypothetical protein
MRWRGPTDIENDPSSRHSGRESHEQICKSLTLIEAMGPRWVLLTPGETGRLTVGFNMTFTLMGLRSLILATKL